MNRGALMKQHSLSAFAAIALFVVLVGLYTMPYRNAAPVSSINTAQTEQVNDSTGKDDKQALKRGFHSLFNALFDR
jgi:hypothetical protein